VAKGRKDLFLLIVNPPNLATLDRAASLIREEFSHHVENSPLIRGAVREASRVYKNSQKKS